MALHRFDFDVDRSQVGTTRVRYAFTEARTNDTTATNWYAQVGETARADGSPDGTCATHTGWSTRGADGNQIQPVIRRSARNAAGALPATPESWASWISSGSTFEPAETQVRLLAFPVSGSTFGTPRDLTDLTNYPLCTTRPTLDANGLPVGGGFWGDYFGLVHFLAANGTVRHVAAITDSRGPSCTRGVAAAAPQHIQSVVWGTPTP